MSVYTTFKPFMGALAGSLHIAFACWVWRALIEGHRDISAEGHLNFDSSFWCELDFAAIAGIAESDPVIINTIQLRQAEHLKPA
jgi:hypothetical protein